MIIGVIPEHEIVKHDGRPLLYTCVTERGRYICTLSEEDEATGQETWLCAPISDETLRAMCGSQISVCAAFAGRPRIIITVPPSGKPQEQIMDEIPGKWLPSRSIRLSFQLPKQEDSQNEQGA